MRLVFWNFNHLEVASGPFCLLLHSPWPLVFALCLFNLFFLSLNLFCWKGFHFSWSNSLIFVLIIAYLFFSLHFWIRDLIREFSKKYEILLICLFLLFFIFLASEALLFISFFWASFHSLSSLTLGVSLGEGFYLPDPFEITFANTLLLSNAAVCLGGAFVSLELSLEFFTFFSLFSFIHGHLLVCKSKNFRSWVYQLMIQFIVVSSFFLQDYISFIFSLVFFFYVFFFGVVVFLQRINIF